MADVTIEARPRKLFGKKCRYLRRAGITPANLYGAGLDSIAVQVDTRSVTRLARSLARNTPVQLVIRGEQSPRTAFLWEVQRDPLLDEIVHVDFYHVEATRRMRAVVPLVLEGIDPQLDKLGKRVQHLLEAVSVETLPADLPTEIAVDASSLVEIDDEIKLSSIKVSELIQVLDDPSTVIAKVSAVVTRGEAAGEDELGAEGDGTPVAAETPSEQSEDEA